MSSLGFLQNIKVDDPTVARKPGGGGVRKEWNPPTGLAIRIWKDGQIYPSADLVKWFSLEYRPEDAVTHGNGLDVFTSKQATFFKSPDPLILINVVDREKPKVDVFGTVMYYKADAEEAPPEGKVVGDPTSSVMDQGSSSYGKKHLLPMIKDVYGLEPSAQGFIDLLVLGQDGKDATKQFELPDGKLFCHIPKFISRGDNAGGGSYVKRDHPRLYVLYPAQLITEEETPEATA